MKWVGLSKAHQSLSVAILQPFQPAKTRKNLRTLDCAIVIYYGTMLKTLTPIHIVLEKHIFLLSTNRENFVIVKGHVHFYSILPILMLITDRRVGRICLFRERCKMLK